MVGFVCFVFLVSLCTSTVCGSNGKLDEFTNRNGVIIVVNEDRLYFNQNLIDNNYKSGQFYCARAFKAMHITPSHKARNPFGAKMNVFERM